MYFTLGDSNLTQARALQLWYQLGVAALPSGGRMVSESAYPCAACCTGKQPQAEGTLLGPPPRTRTVPPHTPAQLPGPRGLVQPLARVHVHTQQLPDLCRLGSAQFKVWDVPTAHCPAAHGCRGAGHGTLVRGSHAACDGVTMESLSGMAASFFTEPFLIEPTVVYNVSYEIRTTGLVATTAFLSGGVYAQFYDRRADFNGTPGTEFEYGDGWFPGLGQHELENSGGFVARSLAFAPPTTAKYSRLHLTFAAHTEGYTPDRIHGGAARGKVEIRSVQLTRTVRPPQHLDNA